MMEWKPKLRRRKKAAPGSTETLIIATNATYAFHRLIRRYISDVYSTTAHHPLEAVVFTLRHPGFVLALHCPGRPPSHRHDVMPERLSCADGWVVFDFSLLAKYVAIARLEKSTVKRKNTTSATQKRVRGVSRGRKAKHANRQSQKVLKELTKRRQTTNNLSHRLTTGSSPCCPARHNYG